LHDVVKKKTLGGGKKMFLLIRSVRGMSRFRIAALLSIVGLLPADALQAQTGTWTGAGGATWNTTATNWSGVTGTPWDATNGLTGIATFDGANTPSVSGTVYVNQINKSATAGNTVISNGSGTIILAGSNPTITNNSTAALNIAPILSSASGVTVTLGAGAGTAGGVTFSGNNTYSGTTTINGANNGLTVTNNGALGTSSVLVNANGILKVSTGALSNAITINGGASNGAIQTFTSSTLSGLITVASNAIIGNRGGGSTLNLTGGIAASGQTLTLGGVGGSSSTIISANVVNLGSGGTFRASAQPVTVNIGGNTWGTTLVDWGGAINLGATDALATVSILQMGSSGGGETATVDLNGFSQTVAGLRSFTGSGTASASGTRIVRNTGSAATLTVSNTTAYTYDGQINGAVALTKGGVGTLTLSGSSSYSGVTTVSAGNLTAGSANALGDGSGQLTAAGGTLNLGGFTVVRSGTVTFSGGTVQNGTLTNDSTAYDAQSGTVSASLSGSAGLTKTTSGTLNLNNSNSYSGGTTISAGAITLNAAGALGSGAVVVASGARLSVSNAGPFSNAITINGNGGANGAIQTFTSSTLSGLITLASDATIGNRAVSTLNLTGGIAASGQTLTFSPAVGSVTTISTNVVNLGAGGTLRTSAAPLNVNIGGNTWGTTQVDWSGTINLGTTNALAIASILQLGSSGGGETATVDLNGFSQTIAGLRSFTGSGTSSASGTRTVTSATAATFTIDNSAATSYLYDGVISGAISLTKSGNSTQTLSGSNSYTGATTVSGSGSVLVITNANALGNTSGATTVGNRAELRLSGGISVAEPITLNGLGAARGSLAALTNTSGTNTVTGLITLGTEATENWIASRADTLNITGGVTSPNRQLTLTGAGNLNVSTNAINLGTGGLVVFGQATSSPVSIGVAGNTMGSLTVYYGGKLRTDVANAFSSSTGLIMGSGDNSNGTLDLNGNSQTFGSLESAGNGTVVITSASAATLSVNQTANRTYAGTITGAVSLTKGGASALTLTGSNTFTGATDVNAGTLAVNGSIASAVNVANAAILGGAGTINGLVTVAGGGILAPGNSPGTLTMTSGLSLADSSVLNFEFSATDTTVGGGINDLVVVTGNFLLDGVLNVAGTGDFSTVADNTKWRLFNYSGGTFTDGVLALGTMPSVGASGKYFQIDTATAGQVNLVIVPEPGAIVLAGVGIAAAAWAIRRRTA
jgi:fibronectin-binding autotransporter adhesin